MTEVDRAVVTSDDLSRLFDCSIRQIEMLAKDGIAVRVGRGRYNAPLSTRNYIRHLRASAAGRSETADAAGTINTPDDAVRLIRNLLREEGAPSEGPMQPSMVRNAETILKARAHYLKIEAQSGRLVDAATVHKKIFELARGERDALLNWPSRVVALIAAEIGADQVKLAVVLEKHVREYLAERAEPHLRLAG
jgi:phage terminase Nu1 subunit (DNA packaging protein)